MAGQFLIHQQFRQSASKTALTRSGNTTDKNERDGLTLLALKLGSHLRTSIFKYGSGGLVHNKTVSLGKLGEGHERFLLKLIELLNYMEIHQFSDILLLPEFEVRIFATVDGVIHDSILVKIKH